MTIPADIEKRKLFANEIRKLVVNALVKEQLAEDAKTIKKNIKSDFGKDINVDGLVKASVNETRYLHKAQEALAKTEEAIGEYSIIQSYVDKTVVDREVNEYFKAQQEEEEAPSEI